MIIVTGATGNVGRALIDLLVDARLPVRAACRNPQAANLPEAVEVYRGSVDDGDMPDAAFEGVERAISLTVESNLPRHAENLVALGKRHGLRHVVLVSSLACEMSGENFLKGDHYRAEQTYMQSGLDWTILRSGVFNTNTATWAPEIRATGTVHNYLRNDPYACIATGDIAAVAATCLASDDHIGKIYDLTGPERITPEQQVEVLSDVLGKRIEFIQLEEAEAQDHFKTHVFPHFGVPGGDEVALALLQVLRNPILPWLQVRPDVEQVLGRRGASYREWAMENAGAFR